MFKLLLLFFIIQKKLFIYIQNFILICYFIIVLLF